METGGFAIAPVAVEVLPVHFLIDLAKDRHRLGPGQWPGSIDRSIFFSVHNTYVICILYILIYIYIYICMYECMNVCNGM